MRLTGPIGAAVLAPTAIGTLLGQQPIDRAPDHRIGLAHAGGIERGEDRPGTIDVIGSPAAEPRAVRFLLATQIGNAGRERGLIAAELAEQADATRRDIRARRIEQRAVIGEGDVVEIVVGVVDIEGSPAAIAALHADEPFRRAGDRFAIFRSVQPVERQCHHRSIVEIGVMRIGVLERPTAGPKPGPRHGPIAGEIGHLAAQQPFEAAPRRFARGTSGLEQGMRSKPGVPDRGEAGLAVAASRLQHQQFAQRGAGNGDSWIARRHAETVEHHHRIGHRRVDAAEPVLAIEPRGHESDGSGDRPLALAPRKPRFGPPQHPVDEVENHRPDRARGARRLRLRARHEQFADARAARIARPWLFRHQDEQGGDHRPRPIRDLAEMKRKPSRQEHDLDRHDRHRMPGQLAEQRQLDPGEDIDARRAAARQNGIARPHHMRCIRAVACGLQGEIGFDATAQIEIAAEKERLAAMFGLARA